MWPFVEIFHLRIPSYGLLSLLGAVFGTLLFAILCRRRHIETLDAFMLAVLSFLGALAGAKLLALALDFPRLLPWLRNYGLAAFWAYLSTGGLVFFGGLLGGAAVFVFLARHYKLDALDAADCAAPAVALGHAFGRLGCFAVGCCFGRESERWGLCFHTSPIAPNHLPLLPVQLFEALFNLCLMALLLCLHRKARRRGVVLFTYGLLYGFWRFMIEFFRGDEWRGHYAGLSTSQWISLGLIVSALLFYHLKLRQGAFTRSKEKDKTQVLQ